jgi:hypothetical protein
MSSISELRFVKAVAQVLNLSFFPSMPLLLVLVGAKQKGQALH